MTREHFVLIQQLAQSTLFTNQLDFSDLMIKRPFNPKAITNMLSHIGVNVQCYSDFYNCTNNNETTTINSSIIIDVLNVFPNEIICLIALFLDHKSLNSLLRTSKQVNAIVDDDQFWEMKCGSYFDRETLTIYQKRVGNYKNIYSDLIVSKKPFYQLKNSFGNVFIFHETVNSDDMYSFFDFGAVYIDPRECSELSEMVNQPYENLISINNCKNNLLKLFTMGIRQVLFIVDVTECDTLDETECKSKLLTIINDIGRKTGFKKIDLLCINYKSQKGVSEMLSLLENYPKPAYQSTKNLRGFILDIEHQQVKGNKLDLIAKVGLTSGGFSGRTTIRLVLGNQKTMVLDSYSTTSLYEDSKVSESRILRIHLTSTLADLGNNGSNDFPIAFMRGEMIYLIDEELAPQKTKTFLVQLISLGVKLVQNDLFLCIGYCFKILVKVKSIVSSIDKRSGRVVRENPDKISRGEAAIVEFEVIDNSYCMIAPFSKFSLNGSLSLHAIPKSLLLDNKTFTIDRVTIRAMEQYIPDAVAVCKSVSSL